MHLISDTTGNPRWNIDPASLVPGTITGVVRQDDGDGMYGLNDLVVPGTIVELLIDYAVGNDLLVATTTTDVNGVFTFDGVSPCLYTLRYTPPPGLEAIQSVVPFTLSAGQVLEHNELVTSFAPPSFYFSQLGYTVNEHDGQIDIVVLRNAAYPGQTVVYEVRDGTQSPATRGSDYVALLRGLLVFAPGETSRTLTIPILSDLKTELNETVLLTLRSPTGAPIPGPRSSAVLTIIENAVCTVDDALFGGRGADIIMGDFGYVTTDSAGIVTEVLIGGDGKDRLFGNEGKDRLHGQDGDDRLEGGSSNDTLWGNEGDDTFVFGGDAVLGNDTIIELIGEGEDTLDFSKTASYAVKIDLGFREPNPAPSDSRDQQTVIQFETPDGTAFHLKLNLSDGDPDSNAMTLEDTIENVIGGIADDTLYGNLLDNRLTGGPGSDLLDGRAGTDTVVEARDVDFVLTDSTLSVLALSETDMLIAIERAELAGGPSANRFDVSGWTGAPVLLDGRAGTDTVVSMNNASFTLTNMQLTVTPGAMFLLTEIERAELTGGAGDNTFDTTDFTGAAVLTGGAGNDTFLGAPGDTTYILNADELGNDTITDSGGNDTFDFSATTLMVTVDLVNLATGVPQPISTNLMLTLLGGAIIENVLGGAGNDTLIGNAVINRIEGGAGDDTITGNGGADLISGGAGADLIIWNDGDGNDVIDGDADADFVRIYTGNGADNISFNKQGVSRIQVAGTAGTVFTLDIGGVEAMELQTG
ncbi:MAG TPA: Calx-beta domain-containing protein, partial [Verrucomicrobiae bacterium]